MRLLRDMRIYPGKGCIRFFIPSPSGSDWHKMYSDRKGANSSRGDML